MIKFGGVECLLPDPAMNLDRWMEQYQSLDDLCLTTTPSHVSDRSATFPRHTHTTLNATGLPSPGWEYRPPQWKINSLWWPTGASRWAIALVLVDTERLNILSAQLNWSSPSARNQSAALVFSEGQDGYSQSIETQMYALPPRPISADVTGSDRVFLLPLVDARYYWQQNDCGNVYLNYLGNTWDSLLNTVAGQLGISVTGGLSGYGNVDWATASWKYKNAAALMDAIAFSCNRRFVRKLDGSCALESAAEAASTVDDNHQDDPARNIAGGKSITSDLTRPSNFRVVFNRRQGGIVEGSGAVYQKNISKDGKGGQKTVHSSHQADFSARLPNPDNQSACDNLAQQIADDMAGWWDKSYDTSYLGLKWWVPSGFDNWVWWRFGGREQGGDGLECYTRALSLSPEIATDFQFSQYNNYPRTFIGAPIFRAELVEDFTTDYEEDDMIDPPPPRAKSRIYWLNNDAFETDQTDIYIYDTLNKAGNLAAGDQCWVSCLAHDTNRFEVISGNPEELVWFELYEPLSLAGEADAYVMIPDGDGWEVTDRLIIVQDPYINPGMWQGYPGYRGIAKLHGDSGKYDIIWMETIARWIRYSLRADLTSTSASADVLHYHLQGKDPGAIVNVFDVTGMWAFWHQQGCTGWAHWNDRQERYEITTPQLIAKFCRGTNKYENCDGSSMTVENIEPLLQGYYSATPNPAPSLALNPRKHRAKEGAKVLIMAYSDGTQIKWEVIDVEVYEVEVLKDVYWGRKVGTDPETEDCPLYGRYKTIFVEVCKGDDEDRETILDVPLHKKSLITSFSLSQGDSSNPECKILASTKQYCVLGPDTGNDGDTIEVASMTKQEVITAINENLDGTELVAYTDYVWVLCIDDGNEVPIFEFTTCETPPP